MLDGLPLRMFIELTDDPSKLAGPEKGAQKRGRESFLAARSTALLP